MKFTLSMNTHLLQCRDNHRGEILRMISFQIDIGWKVSCGYLAEIFIPSITETIDRFDDIRMETSGRNCISIHCSDQILDNRVKSTTKDKERNFSLTNSDENYLDEFERYSCRSMIFS